MTFPKEELITRREAWSAVSEGLIFSGRHTKRELKIFENYFVKFKNPIPENYRDPIPLIYRLWLCPDQSDDGLKSVLNHIMQLDQRIREESIRESQRILFEEAGSSRYDGVDGAPLGFMGGAEKRLIEFLLKNTAPNGARLISNIAWNFRCYEQLTTWLRNKNCNPYQTFRYVIELWIEKLQSETYLAECAKGIVLKKSIRDYFKAIKDISSATEKDIERYGYAEKINLYLESTDAPELLQKWWKDV